MLYCKRHSKTPKQTNQPPCSRKTQHSFHRLWLYMNTPCSQRWFLFIHTWCSHRYRTRPERTCPFPTTHTLQWSPQLQAVSSNSTLSPTGISHTVSGKCWKPQTCSTMNAPEKNLSHSLFNTRREVQLRKNLGSFRILKANGEKRNIFTRIFIHVLHVKIRKHKMADIKLYIQAEENN